ncbi:hypothetical protein ACHAXH_002112 [Discostella pseudostelligera]
MRDSNQNKYTSKGCMADIATTTLTWSYVGGVWGAFNPYPIEAIKAGGKFIPLRPFSSLPSIGYYAGIFGSIALVKCTTSGTFALARNKLDVWNDLAVTFPPNSRLSSSRQNFVGLCFGLHAACRLPMDDDDNGAVSLTAKPDHPLYIASERPIMSSHTSNKSGDTIAGGLLTGNLWGAPFPPRPKAIATFLASADFVPGCQTLLHSLKTHLAPISDDQYPPEIIVLLSSKMTNDVSKYDFLHPIFCDRIMRVDHIPISKNMDALENSENNKKSSHIQSWDDNCGWTKLRLFELESYDTILYIDADCLVVKDVSPLLHIDESPTSRTNNTADAKRMGLLAAAPDIFPPDRFNAGVMVLRPSKLVFDQMMSRLPNSSSKPNDSSTECCTSYDGGDTGFLNSFYPGWFHEMPSYSRLSFGYNAQRFMHHCTYNKQPKYWDDAIDDLRIIHFSSSPKPWEISTDNNSHDEVKEYTSYLSSNDECSLQLAKSGKLERMWHDAYKQSQRYHEEELQKQSALKRRRVPDQRKSASTASFRSTTPRSSAPPPSRLQQQQNPHSMAQRRYKELRKAGMDMKQAMLASRTEYGLDKADNRDAGKAVGQMFGLA